MRPPSQPWASAELQSNLRKQCSRASCHHIPLGSLSLCHLELPIGQFGQFGQCPNRAQRDMNATASTEMTMLLRLPKVLQLQS